MMHTMKLTVGICAYNEGLNIGRLLSNILCEQELSAESEVLIVCSGCTDHTVDIVKKYAEKDSRVKTYVENERQGKASAINHILANAKGDAILFISADTLPQKGCFSQLILKLQFSNVGIVNGKPEPVNSPNSLVGRLVQLLWRFHDHVFEQLNDAGLARHATEIFCIRKGIVDKIPTDTVNDDAYLGVITKKKGWFIEYEPKSCVSISGPQTFLEYFRQRRRIIFGHYQVRKLTGESPQYLVHLMPLYPTRVLKLASWLCTEYDILTLLAFILTELMVNTAATIDFVLRKSYVPWGVSPSTKRVTTK